MRRTGFIAGLAMLALVGCGQGKQAAPAAESGAPAAAETTTAAEITTAAKTSSGTDESETESESTKQAAAETTGEETTKEVTTAAGSAETSEKETELVKAEETTAAAVSHSGFTFIANGIEIGMNEPAAPIVEALGSASNYFESPSCAFQGIDKTYTYSGFELYTYPKNKVDYVSSIYILDESVSTKEGIHLGSALEEMTAAYGSDYKEDLGAYTYTKDKSTLTFIIDNGTVSSIEYVAIVKKEKQ